MSTYINLTENYRLCTNKDDFTLEQYKPERESKTPQGKPVVMPAAWVSMQKYFPNVFLAVKYLIQYELLSSEESISLDEYLIIQSKFYQYVEDNLYKAPDDTLSSLEEDHY